MVFHVISGVSIKKGTPCNQGVPLCVPAGEASPPGPLAFRRGGGGGEACLRSDEVGAGLDAVDSAADAREGADEHAVGVGREGLGVVALDVAQRAGVLGVLVERGGEGHEVVAGGVALDRGQVDVLRRAVGDVGHGVESDGVALLVEGHHLVGDHVAVGCHDVLGDGVEVDGHAGRGRLTGAGVEGVLEVLEVDDGGVLADVSHVVGHAGGEGASRDAVALELGEVGLQNTLPEGAELGGELELHADAGLTGGLRVLDVGGALGDDLLATLDAVGEAADGAGPFGRDGVVLSVCHDLECVNLLIC